MERTGTARPHIGSGRNANLFERKSGTYCGNSLFYLCKRESVEEDFEEVSMARIIIRCKYSGHYVLTSIDTQSSPAVVGGRVVCPYCGTEHVWTIEEARTDVLQRKAAKLIVRQAS